MTLKAMEGTLKQGVLFNWESSGLMETEKKFFFNFFLHVKNVSAETIYPALGLRGKI